MAVVSGTHDSIVRLVRKTRINLKHLNWRSDWTKIKCMRARIVRLPKIEGSALISHVYVGGAVSHLIACARKCRRVIQSANLLFATICTELVHSTLARDLLL